MKKIAVLALAMVGFVGSLSAANRMPGKSGGLTPAQLIQIIAAMDVLDGLPCNGYVVTGVAVVSDIEDLGNACNRCARCAVHRLPEVEVRCNALEELRTFVRAAWRTQGVPKSTRVVLTFELPDMDISSDDDGYVVAVGSLTLNMPKHIVDVVCHPGHTVVDMSGVDVDSE